MLFRSQVVAGAQVPDVAASVQKGHILLGQCGQLARVPPQSTVAHHVPSVRHLPPSAQDGLRDGRGTADHRGRQG